MRRNMAGHWGHHQALLSWPSSPEPPQTLFRVQNPKSAPGAIRPCPREATTGTVSISPQTFPTQPWVPLAWTHLPMFQHNLSPSPSLGRCLIPRAWLFAYSSALLLAGVVGWVLAARPCHGELPLLLAPQQSARPQSNLKE